MIKRLRLDKNSAPAPYLAASVCLAASLAARWAVTPLTGANYPFAPSVLGVLVSARYFGAAPGAFAAVGGAAGVYALLGLQGLPFPHPFGTVLYIVISATAIWLMEVQRRAIRKAEESARLADERLEQLHGEIKQRERDQKLSAQLGAIVESSEDAIVSKDLDGKVQSWNMAAERIFGYRADEIIGRPISLLVPGDRMHEESDISERIHAGSAVKHFETVRLRRDGTLIQVALSISPIRDSAGKIVGASHIARDITEQKELEEQLRQAQKMESLGVLAGGLAHDFNNLLTGIMGNASLAMDELDGAGAIRDRLDEVIRGSERAALLVRQMLAYAGKSRFVIETLDLSAQIVEIASLIQTSMPHSIELDLQVDGELPPIDADRSHIQQLVMNLATNAAEAMGERSGKLTIATRTKSLGAERRAVLEIADTGCGMDEETKARIFDPFFSTKFTGRGLGLAAVMGIVRSHRATISVETAPGRGSAFRVEFPETAAPQKGEPRERSEEERGQGRILVADDEEMVRKLARFTLERCGYAVEVAPDGKAAVEAFASEPHAFTVVLLDLTMPVMSGEEALHRIRQIRADVPVVLSSGYSEVDALRRFQNRGLAGFLQKPYTSSALARKIREAVRQQNSQ